MFLEWFCVQSGDSLLPAVSICSAMCCCNSTWRIPIYIAKAVVFAVCYILMICCDRKT